MYVCSDARVTTRVSIYTLTSRASICWIWERGILWPVRLFSHFCSISLFGTVHKNIHILYYIYERRARCWSNFLNCWKEVWMPLALNSLSSKRVCRSSAAMKVHMKCLYACMYCIYVECSVLPSWSNSAFCLASLDFSSRINCSVSWYCFSLNSVPYMYVCMYVS